MNDAERPITQQKSQLVYWIFQLTAWGLFSVSRFVAAVVVLDVPWMRLALELLFVDAVGLGLSHWLRDFVRRHHWSALPFRKLGWRVVVAAFVLGTPLGIVTQFTGLSALHDPAFLKPYAPALSFQFSLSASIVIEIVNSAFLYIIWLTIYFTAIAVREHRRLHAQLRDGPEVEISRRQARLFKAKMSI